MQCRKRLREGQAESQSGVVSAVSALHEHLEYLWQEDRGDADSVVAYAEDDFLVLARSRHFDGLRHDACEFERSLVERDFSASYARDIKEIIAESHKVFGAGPRLRQVSSPEDERRSKHAGRQSKYRV